MSLKTTPETDLGAPAPDFALSDFDGHVHTRDSIRGEHGLLVMFICNHCPYVQAILPRLARDVNACIQLGIGAVAISVNDIESYPQDAPDKMQQLSSRYGFRFPYLYDASQQSAKDYGAVCTPDFFGYNGDLKLQYRGRLDAGGVNDAGQNDPQEHPRELFNAMQKVIAEGVGPADQQPSMGCSIKWLE